MRNIYSGVPYAVQLEIYIALSKMAFNSRHWSCLLFHDKGMSKATFSVM